MKLLKVFLYHHSNKVVQHLVRIIVLFHKYKIMPYMFRSDFPIIIKQIHVYVDDHHGPHHGVVMVREFCIAIDENRFTVFLQLKRCVIWSNTYALYKYMKLYLYMVFHDGLSCALPMIIVRYMYTVYHYFLFSFIY